jgi:diaminopimelate epimerase
MNSMISFAKAHAYGNDFLYVDERDAPAGDLSAFAVEICDRHAGVGADGLIVYVRNGASASMRLWNADGSASEVSGNGVRGLAALLLKDDPSTAAAITIETGAGAKQLTRLAAAGSRQQFRSAMGAPSGIAQASVRVDGETLAAVVLNVGNPQCVLLGPLPSDERFNRLGPLIEHHPMFPNRTNVEFACVETPVRIRIRIWERGAGPTQSSGTGSCASLVAAAAFGGAARDAEVVAPGGTQRVEWLDDGVYLTGWAEVLCSGEWLPHFPRTRA